jgi:hypothetical protein
MRMHDREVPSLSRRSAEPSGIDNHNDFYQAWGCGYSRYSRVGRHPSTRISLDEIARPGCLALPLAGPRESAIYNAHPYWLNGQREAGSAGDSGSATIYSPFNRLASPSVIPKLFLPLHHRSFRAAGCSTGSSPIA